MSMEICIDANVMVKWYFPEDWREQSVSLGRDCLNAAIKMIAPDFIFAEATSAIRRKAYRKLIGTTDGLIAAGLLLNTPVKGFDVRDLCSEAWRLADKYNLPTLYDAYYLALAEQRGCDFWTADERLVNATGGLSYIKLLRDYMPGQLG